jgi:hypothetical protein
MVAPNSAAAPLFVHLAALPDIEGDVVQARGFLNR